MPNRVAQIKRTTKETDISLKLNLDGHADYSIDTGIGFFDHMLELFAKHGGFDLDITCKGDLKVDSHHTVEDVGLCLGEAIYKALGDKKGINRYGFFLLPMDEALVRTVIDLSNRPYFILKGKLPSTEINGFPPELASDFFHSISDNGKFNLHIELCYGRNSHHCLEAIFKCFARALSAACGKSMKDPGIPSTKGIL